MAEADERKAGALILRDLELFNRAVVYVETDILGVAHAEVGQALKGWIEARGWKGESKADDFEDLWVAPPQWHAKEDNWFAWFMLSRRDGHESVSYQLADLFGVGQTDFGFRFCVDHGWFGGKSAWNNYARTLGDIGQRLGERGWVHEGKGVFFRPVTLPADCLAGAWENEDWTEAVEPLEWALDALAEDVPIFDDLVKGAKPKDE